MTEKTHQLINVVETKDSKWKPVVLMIERINGEKKVKRINQVKAQIYCLNDEGIELFFDKRKPRYMKKEYLDRFEVAPQDLFETLIDLINDRDPDRERAAKYIEHYNRVIGQRDKRDLAAIHRHPFFFSTDANISDSYISRWYEMNADRVDDLATLKKAFFDIEVDIIDHIGFPDEHEAPCPINMISYEYEGKAYLFILENEGESFRKFKEEQLNDFIAHMIDEYGQKAVEKGTFPIPLLDSLEIRFFEGELDLLVNFFALVNEQKPDTLSAYNLKFDFLTIVNRIERMGYKPEAIMVPSELQDVARVYYYEDTKNNDWADKTDSATVTGATVFSDQLLAFASIRKTMGKRDSYTLDAILEEECGFSKLSLKGKRLKDLPYEDFYYYSHYSLRDTLGLKLLENKNKDLDQLYGLARQTRTRLEKAFTKTVCLRNYAYEVRKHKEILTSNENFGRFEGESPKPKMKFEGAVVADPTLVAPVFTPALGYDSRYIRDNVIDFDFESLHPSIMKAYMIDYNPFLGTLDLDLLDEDDFDPDQPQLKTKELIEYMMSDDIISTANKYFGLPNMDEILEEF